MDYTLTPFFAAEFARFSYQAEKPSSLGKVLPASLSDDFIFTKDKSIIGVTGGHIIKKTTGMVVLATGKQPHNKTI